MTGETCRVCGCTDHQACPGGCCWAAPSLCSACVGKASPLDEQMAGKVIPWNAVRDALDDADGEGYDMQALATVAVDGPGAFQPSVAAWMAQCFDQRLATDITERCDRFLEEALELLQSKGYDRTRVATLVDYVYGRPVGEPAQEVGGVLVTLAALCSTASIDMHVAGNTELARIQQPEVMAKIRTKQQAKNALHFDTPLPGDIG